MKAMNLKQVKITGGFWAARRKLNAEVTMKCVAERFCDRFDALKCRKRENPSHIFWDSDVAKWLEAAAYVLSEREDEEIRARYEEAVNDVIANQRADGYFNSYFQVYEPQAIFTRRDAHELYCAGHLFEAAAAASENLGDDRLLKFAERYADYIRERFMEKRDTGFVTPGHEEIELALLKLYDLTGEKKYSETAKFFIDERGKKEEGEAVAGERCYSQSNVPVRRAEFAEGHAVRALYLYTAMAHLAKEENDEELFAAAERLYDDVVLKKMYITGATGSVHGSERFSVAYDLPNYTAYAETCAAIALAFFCDRMYRLTGEAKYADTFERALYNGVLAGESLEGNAFFYVNPLEMRIEKNEYNAARRGWVQESAPLSERVKIFGCSCCPPNLCRFFAELGSFIWYAGEEENALDLTQCVTSSLRCEKAEIDVTSGLPYDGKVKIKVNSFGENLRLRVRKPAWCDVEFENEKDGFLVYEGAFVGEEIEIDFAPRLRAVYADQRIADDAGKAAFSYGPLILCAEGADNDYPLFSARVRRGAEENGRVEIRRDSPFVLEATLPAEAMKKEAESGRGAKNSPYVYEESATERVPLKLIPYFAWGNRGKNDMRVWITER